MFNSSRTRVFCLACLTIATANLALAKDEPTSITQQNEDQPAAQSNQQSGPQLEPASNQHNEQAAPQPNQPEVSRDAQRSADEQRSSSDRVITRSGSDKIDRAFQRAQRTGASLGVNITTASDGVVITRVQTDTPAQQMGLHPNDRIISVNGTPAGSADEFISTIRGMNPGDQVELQIVSNDGERTIRGELEPYGQALARNEQPPSNVSRDEGTTARGLRSAEPSAPRLIDADQSATLQTSYEEKSSPIPPQSGDIDARLTRIEQQIDRLTQAVEDLRNTIGTAPLSDRPTSGLREAASAEFRATNPTKTQPRPNAPLQNPEVLKRNDRWNVENRFEQGDLPSSRERATAEAARRRAQQTGAQLQQQERDRAANAKHAVPTDPTTELPPQPTATDQSPGEQKK